MRIVDNGEEKKFYINDKIYNIEKKNLHIEIYEEEDPSHTGHYFDNIEDFIYFINGLTEIAKKFKEEEQVNES